MSHPNVTQGAELYLSIEIWQKKKEIGTITLQTFQRPPLLPVAGALFSLGCFVIAVLISKEV